MIEDKIRLVLKDIADMRDKLKEIKKDMKEMEKIESDEYDQLKKAYKDLKGQIKDIEDAWENDLAKDDEYNQLREMKLNREEDIANANAKLFELISQLPPKPFLMDMETEMGPVKVQIMPEMRVYVNGKEEKKRA